MVGIGNAATTATIIKDGDLNMGAYKVKTDDVDEVSVGHGVDVEGVKLKDSKVITVNCLDGSVIPKKVSDNLRNSHDAEDTEGSTGVAYVKVKTMTFTGGIKGTLRVKGSFRNPENTYACYIALYKNGALVSVLGAVSSSSTYVERSEDLDVGEVAAGETLELWVKAEHGSATIQYKNWRLYYDDAGNAAVMVTS